MQFSFTFIIAQVLSVGLTWAFWCCGSVGRPVEYSSVLSTLTSCISVWAKLNMRPDSSMVMDRA